MVAPEVYLIKEDDREMFFAHRPLAGVVFMLIGMGIVYFFSFSAIVKEQVARWVFSAGGALFALMGFGGALWRYELRLDLLGRTYSGRKGFWPNPKALKGSLDDLEGVVLSSRVERSDKSTYTVWTVSFAFKNWPKPVKVMESQKEIAAYHALEHYAKKLRVSVIDRTGAEERQTAWTDLDKPLAEQPDHAVSIPPLPAGSRIEFTNRPGSRRILLPTRGLSLPGLFIALFGMPFFGMGSAVLWMLITAYPMRGNVFVGWIIAPIFMLVGLFIIVLAIAGMWGRQLIEENGAGISYSLLLAGRHIRPRRLLKQEVEEVSLRPIAGRTSGNQHDLILRSDRRIIRISGSEINQQELEWLKVAVQCLITR